MELLVGFVQALVFMLLTAVFTVLICAHEEEHGKRAPLKLENFSGLTVVHRGSRWEKRKENIC